jgi:hypothetical protein
MGKDAAGDDAAARRLDEHQLAHPLAVEHEAGGEGLQGGVVRRAAFDQGQEARAGRRPVFDPVSGTARDGPDDVRSLVPLLVADVGPWAAGRQVTG